MVAIASAGLVLVVILVNKTIKDILPGRVQRDPERKTGRIGKISRGEVVTLVFSVSILLRNVRASELTAIALKVSPQLGYSITVWSTWSYANNLATGAVGTVAGGLKNAGDTVGNAGKAIS